MSGAEIVLPHGTTFVAVAEIPALLALAINPVPPFRKTVQSLGKVSGDGRGRLEFLTNGDWTRLGEIWAAAGLSPFEDGIDEGSWSIYEADFLFADNRPDWTPRPVWADVGFIAGVLRADTKDRHEAGLREAVARGGLAVDRARFPTTKMHGAVVPLKSFETYAAQFGVTVRIDAEAAPLPPAVMLDSTQPTGNTAERAPAPERWPEKARRYAAEELALRREKQWNPKVLILAEHVARRFREEGIQGDRGPLSAETIKRHALKGIKGTKQRL